MAISQMPSPINKYLAFAFSISLPPSIPLTTPSYSIVFLLGTAFLNYLCNGLPLTYYSAHQPFSSHLISPSEPLTFRVSQGSVLGPILFYLYTTPLSTLISLSSISRLLYTDDTQLFLSFIPKNFPTAICDLKSIMSLIYSWMSFN